MLSKSVGEGGYVNHKIMEQISIRNVQHYSRTPDERPPSPTTIPLIRPHFVWTDSGFCSYTNPSRATIPLIRPHQCDSEGGRIRGVLLYYEVVAWCPIASVRVCVHVHACLHACTCTHTRMPVCMYAYMYACICMYTCMYVHACVRMYVCTVCTHA